MCYNNQKPWQKKLQLLVSPNVVKYNITTNKHSKILSFNYYASQCGKICIDIQRKKCMYVKRMRKILKIIWIINNLR